MNAVGGARVYLLVEDLILLAAVLLAVRDPLPALALFVLVKGAFFVCGLYDFRLLPTRPVFWTRLTIGAAAGAAIGWLLLGPAWPLFVIAFLPAMVVGRTFFEWLSRTGRFRRRVLMLGLGRRAQRTAREMLDERSRECDVVGFLAEKEEERGWRIGSRPVLGLMADLESVVTDQRVDRVVVALSDRRKGMPLDALLRVRLSGVEVVEEPRVHEEIAGKLPVEDLRPSWLIFSDGFSRGALSKRLFDLVAALVGLAIGAPIMLLAAIAVRVSSPGPVFFKQVRVGRGGREFTLVKFRTMRVDAEKEGAPQWAQRADPRVTPVGRFLRSTRLDEMPQMFNVLQGSMSFVGPRPERPYFVEQLREKIPFYDQRHAVKPGITGWAQVRFRYGSDETDQLQKLRFDMYYVKHHSLALDLRILFETVGVVFQRDMGR
ncbi:MAG: TIGR03013 family XrtA/PEP-CTERM system glycosyltransferase [Planctomycetota bacterium]|jgi:sugar transferase (PEP-CTERM system associated)